MDAVYTTAEAISDPDLSIRTRAQRQHFLIAQAIVARESLPLSVCVRKKPGFATGPDGAVATLGGCPHLCRRQFGDARKPSIWRCSDKQPRFRRSPQLLMAIEAECVR